MKRRILPVRIVLSELPPEGRDFVYDREGGELNKALMDLIGLNPYRISFHVKPMGNVYLMEGTVDTELDLLCSRCGVDFKQKIQERLSEILVVQDSPLGRGDSTSRVNHTSDLNESQKEATTLDSPHFDVGEFFHEIIALAEPIQPLGGSDCDKSCENLEMAYAQGWLTRPGTQPEEDENFDKNKPFAGLKGLKLNS